MPWVVQFPNGKFLFRDGQHKRKLVENISEATTWAQAGHAKNAIRAACSNTTKEWEFAVGDFFILEVELKLKPGIPIRYKKLGRDRFGV
jgi:hypothetical protein